MENKINSSDMIKIYLAKSRQDTIKNLQAAYDYFKTRDQGSIYLDLLKKIEIMDETAYSKFVKHIPML